MPRMPAAETNRRAKEHAAALLGLEIAHKAQTDRTQLVTIVQQGQGLAEEATWQRLAEYVASQYGTGTEPLSQTMRELSECAKMQLLIRSLRRKEGGSLESERLAAFQALMAEVYGTNGTQGEEESDDA